MKAKLTNAERTKLKAKLKKLEAKIGHKTSGCCLLGFCGRDAREAARIDNQLH